MKAMRKGAVPAAGTKEKTMEQKQFQAESKRLMDMMIHSIYKIGRASCRERV